MDNIPANSLPHMGDSMETIPVFAFPNLGRGHVSVCVCVHWIIGSWQSITYQLMFLKHQLKLRELNPKAMLNLAAIPVERL